MTDRVWSPRPCDLSVPMPRAVSHIDSSQTDLAELAAADVARRSAPLASMHQPLLAGRHRSRTRRLGDSQFRLSHRQAKRCERGFQALTQREERGAVGSEERPAHFAHLLEGLSN
jgi:hypothetical protein